MIRVGGWVSPISHGGRHMSQVLVVDGTHLRRLMLICRSLSSGPGATLAQLQGKMRTSRRTIFRDLSMLGELGLRVDLGPKGYRVKENAAQCRKVLVDHFESSLRKMLNACLK
jgi:predicted DNA-binding transcriptional regulator YafY